MRSASSGGGLDLPVLFNLFNGSQNNNAQAAGVLIVDETGLKAKVSTESPCWDGPGALALARSWFQEQFGVTFTEETRTMKTYVVTSHP